MHDKPVVIVTGASRGLGAAVAEWLGSAGAVTVLVARSADLLDRVAGDVARLGGTPLPLAGDVADPAACGAVVRQAFDRFGRLDALVNNAGIVQPLEPTARADPEAWQRNLQVNLFGPFYMAAAAIPLLRRQRGRIVNVSSGAANTPLAAAGAYCAAKAALNQLTQVIAVEEPLIACVAVRPGVVDTDMQALIRREGPACMPQEQARYYHDLKKQGLLEPPQVPARSIAWLALYAPAAFSGRFLSYDDPGVFSPARKVFGEQLKAGSGRT